jgi:hypothetical protein
VDVNVHEAGEGVQTRAVEDGASAGIDFGRHGGDPPVLDGEVPATVDPVGRIDHVGAADHEVHSALPPPESR